MAERLHTKPFGIPLCLWIFEDFLCELRQPFDVRHVSATNWIKTVIARGAQQKGASSSPMRAVRPRGQYHLNLIEAVKAARTEKVFAKGGIFA